MPEKCWLHRTNSIEKFNELSSKYKGVEVDVNFDNDNLYFDVTHDLEDSINLSLEEYFKILKNNNSKMWIDLKNLTKENVHNSLNIMNNLTEKYNIKKDRLIIESNNFTDIKLFKDSGYYTSFYVPYLNLKNISSDEKEIWKKKLKSIASSGNVCALSFVGYMYPFIKSINLNIDLLTWEDGKSWKLLFKKKMNREMIVDNQLKVILVKEKGHFHR